VGGVEVGVEEDGDDFARDDVADVGSLAEVGRGDANDLAALVEDGTPGVARVDGGVDLHTDDAEGVDVETGNTDCCGVAVTETLPGPFAPSSPTEIRCHDGILTASKRLADDLKALVQDLLLPAGFKVVITGHSLGAGVAALVGILLRASLPALEKSPPDALKVVAFASPPILDRAAADACHDFCTNVVNQADVIPRSSLANLAVLRSVLAHAVLPRMVERGLVPEDFGSAGAFLQHMMDGDDKEKEWFMTPEEIRTAIAEALAKVPVEDPEHLYIPGTIFLL